MNVNTAACTERKIPVIYAPGRNSGAVAEVHCGPHYGAEPQHPLSHHCLRYETSGVATCMPTST